MAKKTYDMNKLENELKGASAFFQSPAVPKAKKPEPKPEADVTPGKTAASKTHPAAKVPSDRPIERSSARASVRTNGRTPVRSVSRYAFEFYMDQVDELKARSLDDRIRGGSGNMSQMVRQAIDEYLEHHPREES